MKILYGASDNKRYVVWNTMTGENEFYSAKKNWPAGVYNAFSDKDFFLSVGLSKETCETFGVVRHFGMGKSLVRTNTSNVNTGIKIELI